MSMSHSQAQVDFFQKYKMLIFVVIFLVVVYIVYRYYQNSRAVVPQYQYTTRSISNYANSNSNSSVPDLIGKKLKKINIDECSDTCSIQKS